jgi:hypothetical protein
VVREKPKPLSPFCNNARLASGPRWRLASSRDGCPTNRGPFMSDDRTTPSTPCVRRPATMSAAIPTRRARSPR